VTPPVELSQSFILCKLRQGMNNQKSKKLLELLCYL
jgi:hypothetical protein